MAFFKTTIFVLFLISIAFTRKAIGAPRRWERVQLKSQDMFEQLVYFALGSRSTGRFYETLLRIVDVHEKVGPGTSYRIEFMTSKTKCPVSKLKFEKWLCPPRSKTLATKVLLDTDSPCIFFRRDVSRGLDFSVVGVEELKLEAIRQQLRSVIAYQSLEPASTTANKFPLMPVRGLISPQLRVPLLSMDHS